ncbi:MAG: AbfB domain-containing protein [Candidatus Marithrix sp.]
MFRFKWLKKAFLKIIFIGLIASFAQTAAAIDFNFSWPDLGSGEGELDITISLNASTVDVKVKLQNGCVYNSDNVNVNWDQNTIDKFVNDLNIPQLSLTFVDTLLNNGLDSALKKMPIAVTRLDSKTLQVRVGFTDPNPPGALVDVQIKLDSTCGDTPPPSVVSSTLKIGKRITLVPNNFPNMCVGHFLFGLNNLISDGTDVTNKNCTFTVEKGIDGRDGTISLRSVNYPTFYVNHFAFAVNISASDGTPVYRDNASFIQIPGSVADTISLVPVNYRTFLVRHSLNRLLIHNNDGSALFKQDSSFKVMPPLWKGPEGL